MSNQLIEKILLKQVASNISNYKQLVLAFSGGLDSTVLLEILNTLKNYNENTNDNHYIHLTETFILRAIHIHHGLNDYSDIWAKHCLQECKKRNIPCNLIYIFCKDNTCHGVEATARCIRYKYLFKNLHPNEVLLTAQHLDDQAETFLLALKRGSGPTGLSSMPNKKLINNSQLLIRPFLECSKEQIQKYAYHKKLNWIIDDSNFKMRFDRNFLRLKIVPLLKKRWPWINRSIARSAHICGEQEKLLNELLEEELKKINCPDNSLLFEPLLNMTIRKRYALLRRWLAISNIEMPSYEKLYHIWKNIILSRQDATPIIFLNKTHMLRRFRNKLYIVPKYTQKPLNNIQLKWKYFHQNISLPYNLGYLTSIKISNATNKFSNIITHNSEKITSLLNNIPSYIQRIHAISSLSIIRAPYNQETIWIKLGYTHNNIYLIGRTHSKKIKKIWKEFGIPPWMRTRIPLLFYNDTLIAILGILITQDGKIQKKDMPLIICHSQTIISDKINNNYNLLKN